MKTIKEVSAQPLGSKQMEASVPGAVSRDPRGGLKRYLLLKYLQVLVLPLGNEVLLTLGALASLYTAVLLLCSPHVSRKASTVLLSQLPWADGLVVACWGLGALGWAVEDRGALAKLGSKLLSANQHASLLFLSCLSLEALLVTWRPVESRRLRTVRGARLACTLVWTAVMVELLVLQAAEHAQDLYPQGPLLGLVLRGCLLIAPFLRVFSHCLRGALWLGNAWVYYTLFTYSPQHRKSHFH
ncbi:type-1 angiotensin II receptor-like [Anguilla rostrata]|uniref:type-1 angiotensin II receptor-like n=1 Tax=Anguilla rostrata TaxID=7938 RepID=UPI0030CE176B